MCCKSSHVLLLNQSNLCIPRRRRLEESNFTCRALNWEKAEGENSCKSTIDSSFVPLAVQNQYISWSSEAALNTEQTHIIPASPMSIFSCVWEWSRQPTPSQPRFKIPARQTRAHFSDWARESGGVGFKGVISCHQVWVWLVITSRRPFPVP